MKYSTVFLPNQNTDSAYIALTNIFAALSVVRSILNEDPQHITTPDLSIKRAYHGVSISILRVADTLHFEFALPEFELILNARALAFHDSNASQSATLSNLLQCYEKAKQQRMYRYSICQGNDYVPPELDNSQHRFCLDSDLTVHFHSSAGTEVVFRRIDTSTYVFGSGCMKLQAGIAGFAVAKETEINQWPTDPICACVQTVLLERLQGKA